MESPAIALESRSASILIGIAAILSFIPLIFDPATGGAGPNEYLKSMSVAHTMKAFAHGTVIASIIISIVGFISFVMRLGLRSVLVQTGLVTYLLGCIAILSASLIDGFVAVSISSAFANAPVEDAKMAFNSFILLGIAITDFARFGWLMQALATLAFSCCLIRMRGQSQSIIVGIIGFGVASITLAALFVRSPDTLLAIRTIYVVEAIWSMAVAALLWRSGNPFFVRKPVAKGMMYDA